MNYKKLIVCLALPQMAGIIGLFATKPAILDWYAGLMKPPFSPPNSVFGPAWIILYVLMGISSYLVWNNANGSPGAKPAMSLYWIHLAVNASWSLVFFGLRNPLFGLVNIAALLVMIVVMLVRFWQVDRRAAVLLIPYLGWVSFASVLNFFLWRLNG